MITHEDVEAILGPRPWKSRGDELLAANKEEAQTETPKKRRAPRKKKTDETQTTDTHEETIA